jgi:hypothetical protein
MFVGPLAAGFFAKSYFGGTAGAALVEKTGMLSPIAAAFSLPLEMEYEGSLVSEASPNLVLFVGHVVWSLFYNGLLLAAMIQLFQVRWRVAD